MRIEVFQIRQSVANTCPFYTQVTHGVLSTATTKTTKGLQSGFAFDAVWLFFFVYNCISMAEEATEDSSLTTATTTTNLEDTHPLFFSISTIYSPFPSKPRRRDVVWP